MTIIKYINVTYPRNINFFTNETGTLDKQLLSLK